MTIDGEVIRYAQFETYLRDNVGQEMELETDVLAQLFDQFLDEELIIRLAIERGLVPSQPAAPGAPPQIGRRAAIVFLLRGVEPPDLGDGIVQEYYQAHLAEYRREESVRLRQILVDERDQAREAREALLRGEDFADVAARFSQVPVAQLGDERGRLGRDDLPPAFADSIFELETGEVSEVFAADYGYHVFQVLEHFPEEVVPLEQVAEQIRAELRRRFVDDAVASLVAEARGRYNVEVHRSNVPFDYRGFYADEQRPQ